MHEGVPVNQGRPEGASYSRTPETAEKEKKKKGGSIPSPFGWRAAGVASRAERSQAGGGDVSGRCKGEPPRELVAERGRRSRMRPASERYPSAERRVMDAVSSRPAGLEESLGAGASVARGEQRGVGGKRQDRPLPAKARDEARGISFGGQGKNNTPERQDVPLGAVRGFENRKCKSRSTAPHPPWGPEPGGRGIDK
ncbi:hypothetical protein THAOC_01338 [Thalassiosira oceanica]|uniref:Uncharacterized protein n=1 Tax=Thalassiosira oceanica TaxID=159749 RepID=K0TDS6_THAOC|nr:hypothetical protein THAOC_01338 [Thalassiosira oceanica]|eukprot:EJK76873.1 hypothetical protein THAOC_01338 [Thalassiosira oceanica]